MSAFLLLFPAPSSLPQPPEGYGLLLTSDGEYYQTSDGHYLAVLLP